MSLAKVVTAAMGAVGKVPAMKSDKEKRGMTQRSKWGSWLLLAMTWLAWMPVLHAGTVPKVTVRLMVTNAQGTVVATMDRQGNVAYTAAYRPYGQQVKGAPQAGPGYTGHVNDPDTGLVYMQQRYYDPDGRFISPDPIRPTPGNIYNFNRYAYANGNPLRYTDPTGMSSSPACGEVSCAVARMRRLSDSMIFGKAGSWMRSFQHAMDKAGSAVNGAIKKVHVKSVFAGDTKPTYTGVAAYGLGVVAHKTAGPNNDEVALTPAGLGLEATATWHLLDISVNLSNVKPSPIFISGLSGRAGILGVLGIELRYTAPGKYELDITGGFGAAADVHMLDVGTNVSQLDGE